jgi:hypothetical protein
LPELELENQYGFIMLPSISVTEIYPAFVSPLARWPQLFCLEVELRTLHSTFLSRVTMTLGWSGMTPQNVVSNLPV